MKTRMRQDSSSHIRMMMRKGFAEPRFLKEEEKKALGVIAQQASSGWELERKGCRHQK